MCSTSFETRQSKNYCGSIKKKTGCAYKNHRKNQNNAYKNLTSEQRDELYFKKHSKRVLKKYALTLEEYNTMLEAQNHSCAICHCAQKMAQTTKMYVDHSHITGKVRGLLCHKCNTGIGMLNDDLKTIENAVAYLKKYEN